MIKRYSFHIDEYNSSIKEDNDGEYVKYEDIKYLLKHESCKNKFFVSDIICYKNYGCNNCAHFKENEV